MYMYVHIKIKISSYRKKENPLDYSSDMITNSPLMFKLYIYYCSSINTQE